MEAKPQLNKSSQANQSEVKLTQANPSKAFTQTNQKNTTNANPKLKQNYKTRNPSQAIPIQLNPNLNHAKQQKPTPP